MTLRPLLGETTNFLRLYVHAAGKSEVPSTFHLWCGLSLLAAVGADKIWMEKFAGQQLTPNLYTGLLGPSGCGKGVAISFAMWLAGKLDLATHEGNATYEGLIPWMAARQKFYGNKGRLYLVTEELAANIGVGLQAQSFLRQMTDAYTRKGPLDKRTLTGGHIRVNAPCVSWLFGSTEQWFLQVMAKDDITSGALGRMAIVAGAYDPEKRQYAPEAPPDFEETVRFLRKRLWELQFWSGKIEVTPRARDLMEHWYMTRPAPEGEGELATWKRQDDLARKLGMLLVMADGEGPTFEERHAAAAQGLVVQAQAVVPRLIAAASVTPENEHLAQVLHLIEQRGTVQRTTLARLCASRGITRRRMLDALETWMESRKVRIEKFKGGTYYVAGRLPFEPTSTVERVKRRVANLHAARTAEPARSPDPTGGYGEPVGATEADE